MKKIGLLSDTHSHVGEDVLKHLQGCDEIWHAGDFGNSAIAEKLQELAPLRGVFGNIDGNDIRSQFPENLFFEIEQAKILMRHISGTPPKYNPECRKLLTELKPNLLVCGHSHILRIQYDGEKNCLFMNPGAAGKQGWHKVRTLVRFIVDGKDFRDCKVVELPR
jgi:hypothetical protein